MLISLSTHNSSGPYKNVIFDLDGLIVDTEPLYHRATNLALRAAGADYEFGMPEYGELMTGHSVHLNAGKLVRRFSLAVAPADLADAILSIFNVLISNPDNLHPMPGLAALLEYLKQEKLGLAVASGSERTHVEKMLRGLGLADTFAVIAGRDHTNSPKPAPDVYLKALAELGASAQDTVALEDSLTGVRAAQAAGIFVIAVRNSYTGNHDLSPADHTARDLFEVRDFLCGGRRSALNHG